MLVSQQENAVLETKYRRWQNQLTNIGLKEV